MKRLFLYSAFALSTMMTAQEVVESPADDTAFTEAEAEVFEETTLTNNHQALIMGSFEIGTVMGELGAGNLTAEEAQAKIDSTISALYLASASYFENYVAPVPEAATWNDEFSAAYEGSDSAQYPEEYYDSIVEDFDFDFSEFFAATEKKKTFVFEWHFGTAQLLLNDQSQAATMDYVRDFLSAENRILFGKKYRVGGVKSPVQAQWAMGLHSATFALSDGVTMTKDPIYGTTTGLVSIQQMNSVRQNNWSITSFEVPLMVHLDRSPKGTFNEGLNVGLGVSGRWSWIGQASYAGRDLNNGYFTQVSQGNYNLRPLNYGLLAQVGYKKLKATGRLERMPLFKDGAYGEEVFLGSIALGFSLN
jgi:hypothetical protein